MSAKGLSHGGVMVSGTPEERVKRVLKRRNATLTQIAEASGLARHSVERVLARLGNQVIRENRVYRLRRSSRPARTVAPDDFSVALPITDGRRGYRWWSGLA
jgi:hypothetical protein